MSVTVEVKRGSFSIWVDATLGSSAHNSGCGAAW
jgi:hypothetical protein